MELHKNVIKLPDRGRERVLKKGAFFFGGLGILCMLYCAGIGLFIGYGTRFFLIWGLMGAGFEVIALFCAKPAWRRKLPVWFLRTFWICFAVALVIFLSVEAMILSRTRATCEDGADYLIILGAQWKKSGPSMVLRYRLDQAVHYLRVNRETKVIVSGGQGVNEPISEAEGMYSYLVERGIEGDRIQKEDRSTNTYENLKFSAELLDKGRDNIVLVTNDFHVFRAEKLARGQGYAKVCGLAAESYAPMQANNLLREFFGVTKDFLMGNLVYWERE